MLLVWSCLLFALFTHSLQQKFELLYERKLLDYNWKSADARDKAIKDGSYIPDNVAFAGIKVWKDVIFACTPRWTPGVPITLSTLKIGGPSTQNLEPFPSWERQEIGNCNAIQYVKQVEIDRRDRIWIIDNGRQIPIAGGESPGKICPPNIIAIDLHGPFWNKYPVVHKYEFPKNLVEYMSDIVVDEVSHLIYITDIGSDFGLIVYDYRKKKSWKYRDLSMKGDPNFPPLNINGVSLDIKGLNADGIALSPVSKDRTLFYYPLASRKLFALPTSVLRSKNVSSSVITIAEKTSVSEGMVVDNKNNLYFPLDEINAVAYWNIKEKNFSATILAENETLLDWVDPLVIGEDQYLYAMSNRIQYFFNNDVQPQDINYRILRIYIGAKSYKYREEE